MSHYDELREEQYSAENTETWKDFKLKHGTEISGNSMYDSVERPKHYNLHMSGVQCIEITEHMNFCLGNVIKYVWRAGLKEDTSTVKNLKRIEDLEKALWYLKREIKRINNLENDNG